MITMNEHHLPVHGIQGSHNSVTLLQNFRTFFQGFTVEDARALLSAHGLYAFEVDYLRTIRPDHEETHQ
jgi:hypothetical protein